MDFNKKSNSSKIRQQQSQTLNYFNQRLAQLKKMVEEQEDRFEQMEQSMKTLEDTIDSNLYQQKEMTKSYIQASNKDLTRKVHILEKVPQYLGSRSNNTHFGSSYSNYSNQQEFNENSQQTKEPNVRNLNRSQKLLSDFNMSGVEQEEVQQNAMMKENEELHNQIIRQQQQLIDHFKNVMNEKGYSREINNLLDTISSSYQETQPVPSQQNLNLSPAQDQEMSSSVSFQSQDEKANLFMYNNSNASCHSTNQTSNEDTYTYDSTYYQEDTMNNLNDQQPCFTTYVQDDMMRDVYEMNYEQEFNWNFEELQNPSTMTSKLLEDEVQDFEKLVSQNDPYQETIRPYQQYQIKPFHTQFSSLYYQNQFNEETQIYMKNRESILEYDSYSPLKSVSLQ